MNAVQQWWALPDQYDWLSGYLHARRFARPVRIGMAMISGAAVLFPLNALYDPGQVHGRIFLAVSLVVAALHLCWLVLWLTRWPTRNQSIAYGLCFSASVAASTWIAGVPSIGLVGCTALALPGIYFAFFHSSRLVAVNLAIALTVAGIHSAELIRDGQAILAASMIVLVLQLPDTTVEQIAVAADVSPRTFYRYFPTKEAVLICDQAEPIMAAFRDAPADLSPVAAYRHAVNAYFVGLSDDDRHDTIVAQHMLYSLHETRGVLYAEYTERMALMTDALQYRPGPALGLAERRVIAGAIIGVLMAVSDGEPLPEESLAKALDILESTLAPPVR